MEYLNKIIKLLAGAAGAIAGAFGDMTSMVYVLLVMMAVDYAAGLLVAAMGRSHKTTGGGLDSKVGFVGLAKKGLMLLVVLVAAQMDKALSTDTLVFRDAACWFYIANEGLSVLENLTLAGVPFPMRIKKLLEQTKEKENDIQ